MICTRCGQDKPPHHSDGHLCVDCSHAESNRITYYRQHQGDWLAEAREQGIQPWLQQPNETQWEYSVWVAYRDAYPGKKPSLADVAKQLGTSASAVSKVSQRWTFPARLQLWIAECDRITMLQRKEEILSMNKDHIDMSARLRAKLSTAIDQIEPALLKPGEIASLFKVAAELERKARTDTEAQEAIQRTLVVDTANPELKKQQTKPSDLAEVVQILAKAGVLGTITSVKETVTREITTNNDNMIVLEEVEDESE